MMYAWKAVYMIKDKETGLVKVMEYHVAAAVAGDVPEVIREGTNLEGSEVLDVQISRLREPALIAMKEVRR